jgi:hypothetical protein
MLKIEVIRDYGYSGVRVTITRQRGWNFEEQRSPVYQYNLEGFTDGSRVYTPGELAALIFDNVPKFFHPEQHKRF